jgi:hypothetical protein
MLLEPVLKLLRLPIQRQKQAQNAYLLACRLRFFACFCLVSPALADFEMGFGLHLDRIPNSFNRKFQ